VDFKLLLVGSQIVLLRLQILVVIKLSTTSATLMTTPTLLQIVERLKKIYMIDNSDEVLSFKNLSQHNSLFAVYSSLIKQGRLISLSLLFGLQQHRHNHLGIYVVKQT